LDPATAPAPAAGEVMTREVIVVNPQDSIEEALRRMIKHGFGWLPAADGHNLAGIVARKDLLRFIK
jgi:CBS domain-containing protein